MKKIFILGMVAILLTIGLVVLASCDKGCSSGGCIWNGGFAGSSASYCSDSSCAARAASNEKSSNVVNCDC